MSSSAEQLQRRSEWKRRFANRLIKLCPEMNPDAADEISDQECRHAARIAPDVAAERCARVICAFSQHAGAKSDHRV
jgi:hypothetical protein